MSDNIKSSDIDFVLIWVDGNDPKWQQSRKKYDVENKLDTGNHISRYRDWDNLRFWFRGVELFAPWVRKIHFVTCGHYPAWLNKKCDKLNLVRHSDYIDNKYLPTFSANPIEINLHKIEGLAERFVFFNDDCFLLKNIETDYFFKNDLPKDQMIFNVITGNDIQELMPHFLINNNQIINKYNNKKFFIKRNLFKVFNYKYGLDIFRNFSLLMWPNYTSFTYPHLAQPFLKQTFIDVWQKEKLFLDSITSHKFRNAMDVTQYLFRDWQLVNGLFHPTKFKGKRKSLFLNSDKDVQEACDIIKNQKYYDICINDSVRLNNFNENKELIKLAFNKILPNKSVFEL
ncbi:stealth family protein [Arsenophonus sp. aPb]|uniref:stealth family protein n=1 Tax=Arsenophonus sp. aPb TaxID=3041619 RepID=UPI002468B174|nr:stealth family protein [Arsenophonus sp. aPb]WGL98419.1 stealth family protein [Arsenophonus sp. aPb]